MAGDISKMTRLMKLVALLRKNSYPNHRKLQRALRMLDMTSEYAVSQKTIQRDVRYLREVYHAPIAYDNGKRGYYLTDHAWKFEVPQLEEEEMRAVTLGARLAETIMPEPVASQIRDAAERLLCDNPSGLDANAVLIALVAQGARIPVKPAIFREVFEAWQMRRGLAVRYRRGMTGEIREYVLEPQVLAFQDGLWYVKAVIVSENNVTLPERTIRTLALNRFQSAALYPGRFEPDLRLIKEVNEGGLFRFPTIDEVVLHFTDYAIPYARENYEPELIEEQPDGSLLVTIYDAIDFKIVNLVLNEGGAVQVVSPPELAQKVIEQAKKVIEKQEEKSGTHPAYPAYPAYSQEPIIRPGSYENLLTYRKSKIIYDATVLFCRRFLQPGDRTIDQMVQAARSGKQNIVEGAKASGVSTETELKLTGVARASLEELLEDYRDHLRTRRLPIWSKEDEAAQAIRQLGRRDDESFETYRGYLENRSDETFANILICLINQCNYLLDRQIRSQEQAFVKNGGIRERMLKARLAERNRGKGK